MRKLARNLSIAFILLAVQCFASVPSYSTNLPVVGSAKSLYGEDYNHNGIQLIGTNSSGKVSIDSGKVGVSFGGSFAYGGTSFVSPNNGTTVNMGTSPWLVMATAGTISSVSVVLPTSPINGQEAQILSNRTVTAITVSAGSASITGTAVTALTASTAVGYIYRASNTTWYRYQ